MIFKEVIQIKNVYDYKLVRAAKLSEPRRRRKYGRRNHMKHCKLVTSFNERGQVRKEIEKKKRIFAWSITYLDEWKHFHRSSSFALTSFFLIVFLCCLDFCLLRNSEIIYRCIVKSLISIHHIFVEVHLIKENSTIVFWASEFGRPNQYIGLPNSLDTSLK